MKDRKVRNILVAILNTAIIMAVVFSYPISGKAAGKKHLTLEQVQKLSIAADKDYQKIYHRITMKEIRYSSALKAAQIKQKSNNSYTWSPLFRFELNEQATLTEEYQWNYQPIQLNSEINSLKHELTDCRYETQKNIALLYLQAYVCQEKIALFEEQLSDAQVELKRSQAKTAVGNGTQEEVESTKQSMESVNNSLALQMRTLQTVLEKISKQINLDVTEGYELENPGLEEKVQREDLESITEYTLENDQSYYEAKLAESAAYLSLTTVESLMQNKFGSSMDKLQVYINLAKSGNEVNAEAFQEDYDSFLEEIDTPWEGEQEILSVKVSKEWFQGTEGSFYLKDDPYALYTAVLEYEEALTAKEEAEEELKEKVRDGYEALVTAKNTYETAKKAEEATVQENVREKTLQRLGENSSEQQKEKQLPYDECKLESLDALEAYGRVREEYNRLTCNALDKLNAGELTTNTDDLVETETIEGAYYSIDYRAADRIFVFSVQIPENFSVQLTDYELYVNGVKIGEKTQVGKQLKHLSLDFAQSTKVEVYLYQGEELYSVCEINPYTNRGELEITGGYRLKGDEKAEDTGKGQTLAAFSYKTDKKKKITTLTINPKKQEIAYYALTIGDHFLYSEEPIEVKENYEYIYVLSKEFDKITVNFYNKQKELIYRGKFDTVHNCIYQEAENQ